MRILLMAQHFAPEEVSGAVLATELANGLAAFGHKIAFVTSAPSYPYGEVYPGYRNALYQVEMVGPVRVARGWSYVSNKMTFWRRILNYATFSLSSFLTGLFQKKPDIILSFSPPLPLGLSAWLLSRIWQVPWIMRVEDIFPDTAVAMGVLRNRFLIRIFSFLEKFLYRKADHISVLSPGFFENIHKKGIPSEKISIIPIWADPDFIQPLPKQNEFRDRYDLDGKFIILYSGNLGLTSALDDVMVAAELLFDQTRVIFVIVGEGINKETLVSKVQKKGLKNVMFLPYQPRELFPNMLAAADLGLVTLNEKAHRFSLPYKTFNIMASARPILAVVPAGSELARLVYESDFGFVVNPGNPGRIVEVIQGAMEQTEQLERMGQNGRGRLISDFSRDRCISLYNAMFTQVARICK